MVHQHHQSLIGDSGIETPYGTWPLWVFSSQAYTPEVAYLAIGHEYNPPLFHGGQLLAINMTDGSLVWSELGAYIRSVAIANGVLLSLNAYDNQIYAFSKGPTKITVDAPSLGVTTATPVRITGTITDVSAGVAQSEVAKNFPNGVPCVSDASQSKFMEHVYQDQPAPTDTTGVPIVFYVRRRKRQLPHNRHHNKHSRRHIRLHMDPRHFRRLCTLRNLRRLQLVLANISRNIVLRS